jgi:hypothetical protein
MPNVIIWTHPVSGNVCRTAPMEEDRFEGESEEDWFFRAAVHAVPEGVPWRIVDSASLPPDNGDEFDRLGWVDDGETVAVSQVRRAALVAARLVELKAKAVTAFQDGQREDARRDRAIALVTLDEVNALRQWITDFKTAVANAATLAALKTAVAALPNVPQRTATQAKNAVVARLDTSDAD